MTAPEMTMVRKWVVTCDACGWERGYQLVGSAKSMMKRHRRSCVGSRPPATRSWWKP